jgi:hypothetical protein
MNADPESPRKTAAARPKPPTIREIELFRNYYEPSSPGYLHGPRAAALGGFTGTPRSLAVRASKTLRKFRERGLLATALRNHDITLDRIAKRLSDQLSARRTRAFLTADGRIVYADLGPDYKVRENAIKLLLPLLGITDAKYQPEILLAEATEEIVGAEQEQEAKETAETASQGECREPQVFGSEPPVSEKEMEGDGDSLEPKSFEHAQVDDYSASAGGWQVHDDSDGAAESGVDLPGCHVQSADSLCASSCETAPGQAKNPDTRAMIAYAFHAIRNKLEPPGLSPELYPPVSDSLMQSLVAVIHESNEADKIELERKKSLGSKTASDDWGAPRIDGVLVSDIRKQVTGAPDTAVPGDPVMKEADRTAAAASADRANTDAGAMPGPKPVPPEIEEAIREVDKMSPSDRMLARSIYFGVQNIAGLELKARAEEEPTAQVETVPKATEGEES